MTRVQRFETIPIAATGELTRPRYFCYNLRFARPPPNSNHKRRINRRIPPIPKPPRAPYRLYPKNPPPNNSRIKITSMSILFPPVSVPLTYGYGLGGSIAAISKTRKRPPPDGRLRSRLEQPNSCSSG